MTGYARNRGLDAGFLNAANMQLEQNSNDYHRKMQRRTAMFVSSCSEETLLQLKATDKDTFRELLSLVEAYRQHLDQLSDMTERAFNRLHSMDLQKKPPIIVQKLREMSNEAV